MLTTSVGSHLCGVRRRLDGQDRLSWIPDSHYEPRFPPDVDTTHRAVTPCPHGGVRLRWLTNPLRQTWFFIFSTDDSDPDQPEGGDGAQADKDDAA